MTTLEDYVRRCDARTHIRRTNSVSRRSLKTQIPIFIADALHWDENIILDWMVNSDNSVLLWGVKQNVPSQSKLRCRRCKKGVVADHPLPERGTKEYKKHKCGIPPEDHITFTNFDRGYYECKECCDLYNEVNNYRTKWAKPLALTRSVRKRERIERVLGPIEDIIEYFKKGEIEKVKEMLKEIRRLSP